MGDHPSIDRVDDRTVHILRFTAGIHGRVGGRIVGPFRLPWGTFASFLVVAGSVLLAVLWAVLSRDNETDGAPH